MYEMEFGGYEMCFSLQFGKLITIPQTLFLSNFPHCYPTLLKEGGESMIDVS